MTNKTTAKIQDIPYVIDGLGHIEQRLKGIIKILTSEGPDDDKLNSAYSNINIAVREIVNLKTNLK